MQSNITSDYIEINTVKSKRFRDSLVISILFKKQNTAEYFKTLDLHLITEAAFLINKINIKENLNNTFDVLFERFESFLSEGSGSALEKEVSCI